jgi:hypothetical protein
MLFNSTIELGFSLSITTAGMPFVKIENDCPCGNNKQEKSHSEP